MAQVFVSHSSADNDQATRIATAIRRGGHGIFLDTDGRDGINPGADWQRTLLRELHICDVVVFANSGASQASQWCHSELVVAMELGKRIYSLDISPGLASHPLLSARQGIHFDGSLDHGIDRLLGRLDLDGLTPAAPIRWERGRPPYPGLVAMDMADAGVFFGRDDEIKDLLAAIDGPLRWGSGNLVVVLGPSGGGKSSLLRAGVAARLALPGSGWVVVDPFEPGVGPLDWLAGRLASWAAGEITAEQCKARLLGEGLAAVSTWLLSRQAGGARRLLISIDQAEQLALVTAPDKRTEFVSVLGQALEPGSPVTIVMAVRSDHFDELQRLPVIGPEIRSPFVLAPISRDRIAAIVEGPASRAGLTFAPGLVGRLTDDAMAGESTTEATALPFLAFTLRAMYDLLTAQRSSIFTAETYERVGRIAGAVERRANAAEALLPAASGPELDQLLARFLTLSEDRIPVGRPVPRVSLTDADRDMAAILEDQRLLTGTADSVRLAHERLITEWPRLARLVAARRDDLMFRARMERQARDWKAGSGTLPGRDATTAAVSWLARQTDKSISEGQVAEYITAAERAVRRRRRQFTGILTVIVALSVATSAIAITAVIARSAAVTQSALARSEALAAQSTGLLGTNTPLAMLLSLGAYQRAATVQAGSSLIQAASQPLRRLVAVGGAEAIAVSPNGKLIAVGTDDGAVRLFAAATGKRLGGFQDSSRADVFAVTFAPAGDLLAAGNGDGYTTLWNYRTRRRVALLEQGQPSSNLITSVAFSPSGQLLATADYHGSIVLWDVATGRQVSMLQAGHHVAAVALSPDGRTLAVGAYDSPTSGYLELWEIASAKQISERATDADIDSVAFSPDGRLLATGDDADHVTLRDTGTDQIEKVLTEDSGVNRVAFSPAGTMVAAGDDSGRAAVWEVASGAQVAAFPQGNSISGLAFALGGSSLVVADFRHLGLWSLQDDQDRQLSASGNVIEQAVFSPSGRMFATSNDSGAIDLWDTATGGRLAVLPEGSEVDDVAFSPDGKLLVAGGSSFRLGLWDLATGHRISSPAEGSYVSSVAFSPDGRVIAVADVTGHVALWSVATGRQLADLKAGGTLDEVAFDPDGRTLVVGTDDGSLEVWNADTDRLVARYAEGGGGISALMISPHGQLVATGDLDGRISLWDLTTGRREFAGNEGAQVNAIAIGPGGRTLAVADDNGDAGIWDLRTGNEFASVAQGMTGSALTAIALSPDGDVLVTGNATGNLTMLRLPLSNLSGSVFGSVICAKVRANLTTGQWAQYLPGQPYQQVCPGYR